MQAINDFRAIAIASGCEVVTKTWGGTTTIDIEPGQKLVPYTVQWETQGADIW